jgi:SAM-dependent methyltransferase
MDRPEWAPDEIDIDRPSASRMYDYYLGGSHNFATDREVAEQALAILPDIPLLAQMNRAFLRRAVAYCVSAGVRQFLDVGSGIPTLGNVHEVAQRAAPDARVVYVDIDPVAVAHSRAILVDNPNATVIQEDVRRPAAILAHPELRTLLDLDRPIALLMVAVLPFVAESDDPAGILGTFAEALAPGSHLVISQTTDEGDREHFERLMSLYRDTSHPFTVRRHAAVSALFRGFDLVEPGVVWVPQWRPDPAEEADEHPERSGVYGGVGRKP